MLKSTKKNIQPSFFFTFEDTLNPKHPLFILANRIDWQIFEKAFSPLYCHDNGAPAKPIRLMVGLLILKHLRNLSDESLVEQWSENIYYQYFCGEQEFQPCAPCASSELVHFRHRIGESGCELILKESIRINGDDSNDDSASIDSTVQEKNITFPTDPKLHRKIISKCKKIAKDNDIELRQSYTRILKQLGVDQRFRNHPKNRKKAYKADRRVKTIASRLVRELCRKLPQDSIYIPDLDFYLQVLNQKRTDKQKFYSLHEREVCCISKGKEHKKYEFGNKVSIMLTQNTGVIVGALSFRNQYDGHTIEPSLEQYERLLDKKLKTLIGDRGYRGKVKINETEIKIPKPPGKNVTRYQKNKNRKQFHRRAAIEPIIGHLKTDHRLGRNFYKGLIGDSINIMLAASAFNFKRMMNKWKENLWHYFQLQIISFSTRFNFRNHPKHAF